MMKNSIAVPEPLPSPKKDASRLLTLSCVLSVSIDYLMFGELGNSLSNPYADIVAQVTEKLSLEQRENTIKILQLFDDSCSE